MPESYLSFGQNTLFCRHNTIREGRPSLLLVHGLGDSGLAFKEIFENRHFDAFNLVAPDLLGYGRSSHSGSYGFDVHLSCLWQVIDHFGLEQITLVGHSMGGDLGTLLCLHKADRVSRIMRLLNVEGNLTQRDLFISGEAVRAADEGRFDEWFAGDFTYRQVYGDWCRSWLFGHRYLASLQFCDPAAFLQNARELHRTGPEAGTRYRQIPIPKLFVFGQKSLHGESRGFASGAGLEVHEVVGGHHWPMIDYPDDFYGVLLRFCQGEPVGGKIAKPETWGEKAKRPQVAQVKVRASAEYDDPSVRATLEDSNIPGLIGQARKEQDRLLWDLYEGRSVRIADIGCGDGYHARIYAPQCALYHGYEISPQMVEKARRRCVDLQNVEIIEGDAYQVALRSEKYDVVWCLYFGAGNLREFREVLSDYDDAYLDENPRFIGIIGRFYAALEEGGSLFLTLYKDTPQAEEAQRSFYWRTDQFVLTDFGSRFVATDKGFWSVRWPRESVLHHLAQAGVPRANVAFMSLNEIAWLVEARK